MAINKTTLAVAVIFSMLACRTAPEPHAVDAEAAAYAPSDTIALAGLDLDRLRAAPLYSKLPAAVAAVLQSLNTASSALLAYNGQDLTVIARGKFTQAPPGATLVSPNLAVFGAPRKSGAPALVILAEPIAAGHPIWIVARGGVSLPLTGNAANLNHVIRNAESITIATTVDSGLTLAIAVIGRSDNAARNIEETLRAEVTLAAAAEARQQDLERLLKSIQIDRDNRTVRITLTADASAAAKLLATL